MVRSRLFKLLQNKGRKLMPLSVYVAVVLLVFALFIPVLNREIKERLPLNKNNTSNIISMDRSNTLEKREKNWEKNLATKNADDDRNTVTKNNGGQQDEVAVSTDGAKNKVNYMTTEEKSPKDEKMLTTDIPVVKNVRIDEMVWPLKGQLIREQGLSFSKTFSDYRYHNGIDIAAERGAEVVLALAGKVSKKESTKGEGTKITIDHGQGWVSVYEHLAETVLKEGEYYQAGEIVGSINQPGLNEVMEGPHLHYTLYKDDKIINPLDYLD